MIWHTNTVNELIKKRISSTKIEDGIKYFKIPKEREEDFKLWLEFKLYHIQQEAYLFGQKNLQASIRNVLGIKQENDF